MSAWVFCAAFGFRLYEKDLTDKKTAPSSVQTPVQQESRGTILNSLVPHLKSGIPDEVLIPAPEWTTKCRESFISWARISTFALTSSGLSNFCQTDLKQTHLQWDPLTHSTSAYF